MGCTSGLRPKPSIATPAIISPSTITVNSDSKYGYPPQHYKETIKSYFSNKLARGDDSSYLFSKPQKAFKRKGLAYGGEISWRGWLVDVEVKAKSRTGRILSQKPYMVLFRNSVIVEDILGRKHALLTRVGR
jgi:hypothetical protein